MKRALIVVCVAACAARKLGPPLDPNHPTGSTYARVKDGGPPSAKLVATLADKAVGPVLVMDDAGGLVAYLAGGAKRSLIVLPVDASGAPSADARVVAEVPIDSGPLVAQRAGPGFVLAWAALTERGEGVYAIGVGEDGKPTGAPVELARTTDDVVWIALIPTSKGTIACWAEETEKSGANILAVALDEKAKPRGVPSHAARGVSGWQALPSASGAALATLQPELTWTRLDLDAHAAGAPAVIGPAGKDMDVVRAGAGYVAAWTERARPEPSVRVVELDDGGKVTRSRDLTLGRGAGTLTALAGAKHGAMIAWEEARRGPRRVHADVVDKDGVSAGATLVFQTGAHPEIAPRKDGFAILGFSQLCADSAECTAAPFAPSVIALDARGALIGAEALPPAETMPAAFVWNLTCSARDCLALEATSEPKTRVFLAPLLTRAPTLKVASTPAPAPDAPEITELGTLASGSAVIDVASASSKASEGVFTAVLTSNDDGASASVAARPLPGEPVILTKRALPVGGVSVAAFEDGAAVAWATRETGDPQVRVAKLDRKGKKLGELALATAKGDASDVALAYQDGGFLVAWVDGRDGNGEVYAARVSKDLKAGKEERLTSAPGDASDLTILAGEKRAWIAWADARESPKDGFADIYAAAIGADAKLAVPELRILPSAAHSRSPSLAKLGSGAALAWIEDAPAGADPATSQSYGAWLATLGEDGKRASDPVRVPVSGGFASGVWLDPGAGDRARGVLSRGGPDLQLHAFELGSKSLVTWPLLLLDGPPTLDVPLAFAGDAILFGDDIPTEHRLRRAALRWKR